MMGGLLRYGYWTPGRVAGVPVRLHWTIPVGAVVFCGLRPVAWLAFFFLIAVHEAGHALMVRRVGARVVEIAIQGFGGHCRWSGTVGTVGLGVIAWGGVLAQLAVLAAWLLARLALPELHGWAAILDGVLIQTNLILVAFNLLPFSGFDGYDAWRLFGELRRGRGRPGRGSPPRGDRPPWPPEPSKAEQKKRDDTERVFERMLRDLMPESTVDQREDDDESR